MNNLDTREILPATEPTISQDRSAASSIRPNASLGQLYNEQDPNPASPDDKDPLCADDQAFLATNEKIIEAGRLRFLVVGRALRDIRDYKNGVLYKRYGTFEDYCRERWDFGRAQAYRLMDAAEILTEMSPRGDKRHDAVLPKTERQLRALKRLPPDLRQKAWAKAVEKFGSNEIPARDVQKAAREVGKEEGITLPQRKAQSDREKHYRLSEADVRTIRQLLGRLKMKLPSTSEINQTFSDILALLQGGEAG